MAVSVLALDPGNSTGWALRNINGRVDFGIEDFTPKPNARYGERYHAFRRWLAMTKNRAVLLSLVVYERTPNQRGHAARVSAGLEATLTAWCEERSLSYAALNAKALKKFIAGDGDADKAAVIAAVRARGYDVEDHDTADALALLEWAVSHEIAASAFRREPGIVAWNVC